MAYAFEQLLDVTIEHLEALKSEGRMTIDVSADSMDVLREMYRSRAAAARGLSQTIKPSAPARIQKPVFDSTPSPQTREEVRGAVAEPVAQPEVTDLIGRVEDWPVLEGAQRESAMAKLREQVLACTRCSHLAQSRTQVVFGVGSVHAELMFVGEAPGMDEDRQGEPFVGKAGQLLTRIIETMGLSRDTVYIGNVLKCRPDTPGKSFGNRKPTPMEMQTCWPYLMDQIKLIRPKVLIALGTTAVEGLLGKSIKGITRMRGNFQDFRGIPVMPTYHPSYVLRNPAKAIKRQVWEDMLKVMEFMGMEISDQQRQFFTK